MRNLISSIFIALFALLLSYGILSRFWYIYFQCDLQSVLEVTDDWEVIWEWFNFTIPTVLNTEKEEWVTMNIYKPNKCNYRFTFTNPNEYNEDTEDCTEEGALNTFATWWCETCTEGCQLSGNQVGSGENTQAIQNVLE